MSFQPWQHLYAQKKSPTARMHPDSEPSLTNVKTMNTPASKRVHAAVFIYCFHILLCLQKVSNDSDDSFQAI